MLPCQRSVPESTALMKQSPTLTLTALRSIGPQDILRLATTAQKQRSVAKRCKHSSVGGLLTSDSAAAQSSLVSSPFGRRCPADLVVGDEVLQMRKWRSSWLSHTLCSNKHPTGPRHSRQQGRMALRAHPALILADSKMMRCTSASRSYPEASSAFNAEAL